MTKYKIGDKVWLVHTAEIGIVADFVNMHMLKIALGDEMILPVFMDDVELYKDQDALNYNEIEQTTQQTLSAAELYFIKHENDMETGFHLSFVPAQNDELHFFEMVLVNDTNSDVRFEIKLKLNNDLYMHLKNRLSRRYLYNLGDLAYDELNENPVIEVLIEHASHPLFQLKKEFKLKPKTFFKDLSSTPILNTSTYNYQLGNLINISEKINSEIVVSKTLIKQVEKQIKENFKRPMPQKHAHFYIDDVIDLHIENLIPNHNGLTNAEIIKIQLHHFQKALDNAITHRLPGFTVVHGIGKGKLKAEIWELLKQNGAIRSFKNEYHYKYGFGATEIYFR